MSSLAQKDKSIDTTIEIMKVITMTLVVIAHVARMYTPCGVISIKNENIVLATLTKFIYSFHMPTFIAISGMVYYICRCKLKKYSNNYKLIKNKTKRLLLPCIFFYIFNVGRFSK